MLLAILAAASILGARPLSMDDPNRQALIVQNAGRVLLRLDATGYVQARGCDGRLRHVGDLPDQPVAIHIENDGTLTGLMWDAKLSAEQRSAFRQMVRAWGSSDRGALGQACLPDPLSGAGGIETIHDGPRPRP